MLSWAGNTLLDRDELAVGAHEFAIDIKQVRDLGVQWVLHSAAGVVDSITLFHACAQQRELVIDSSGAPNLTTNPYWSAIPTAAGTFTSLPNGAIGSEILPIEDIVGHWFGVRVVVSTLCPSFSFLVHGKGGG